MSQKNLQFHIVRAGRDQSLAVVVALSFFSFTPRSIAHADRTINLPLDLQLLEADCAVRVRVTSIKPIGTEGRLERSKIDIEVLDQGWCRWEWPASAASFEAIGRPDAAAHKLMIPHRGVLEQEREYILFLQGGRVSGSPVSPHGLIAMGLDGTALCGGGEVYGLTAMGLRCSWSGAELSPPLNGAELLAELSAARANASLRRPLDAARTNARSFTTVGVPQ